MKMAYFWKDSKKEADWNKGLGQLQKMTFEMRIELRICRIANNRLRSSDKPLKLMRRKMA